ncbi:unnamed protein product [Eruca vesicaria subsp. sativa]|uniref:Uncharacterized protein n=1 Tax=Eruca vesicaria subsp. sativa TaxID=29727 RepID=A0ABC8J3H7_ERUVS|nr:unnamed protein product [Eruca vesicaria subsp. sativa]
MLLKTLQQMSKRPPLIVYKQNTSQKAGGRGQEAYTPADCPVLHTVNKGLGWSFWADCKKELVEASLKKLGSSEAKLSELADHYISRWQRKLEEKYSFVAKPRSQVSESARAFSKNPAPMGIRPGRPSLSAGASWVLPRSPIRYDIWM